MDDSLTMPFPDGVRRATLADIPALVAIENVCFPGNRLDHRRFQYLLTVANAVTLVDDFHGVQRGYVMLLLRRNSVTARLYSIATNPAHARCGVAARLVDAAEELLRAHGYLRQRLEIRADNPASLALFQRRGYRAFGRHLDYYHDGMDAIRLERQWVRL